MFPWHRPALFAAALALVPPARAQSAIEAVEAIGAAHGGMVRVRFDPGRRMVVDFFADEQRLWRATATLSAIDPAVGLDETGTHVVLACLPQCPRCFERMQFSNATRFRGSRLPIAVEHGTGDAVRAAAAWRTLFSTLAGDLAGTTRETRP